MKSRTKIFLEPDYMIRNGPVCHVKLFCKEATSALFSCNFKNFYDLCCVYQGAEFSFSKRQTAPACVKFSGEGGGGGGGCTLGTFGWGCTARTLEPLAHTRAR